MIERNATQRRFVSNGAAITRARESIGASKVKFAPLVGTTRRHLIRLENGEHLPSSALRDRIVEATGTDERIRADDDEEADPLSVEGYVFWITGETLETAGEDLAARLMADARRSAQRARDIKAALAETVA